MDEGTYLYVALTNAKAGMSETYEDWLLSHHLDDVLAVKGVTSAQQFRFVPTRDGLSAPFTYAAIYTADTSNIQSVHRSILEARATGRMVDTASLDPATSAHWYAPISELRR